MTVAEHYDLLIDENNDPVLDPPALKAYMDKWDGASFLQCLHLDGQQSVLEIGIGSGRIGVRVAPQCASFTGIDLSEKSIERARQHLMACPNVHLICADFMQYDFIQPFQVVYSTLTSMHFPNKRAFIDRACSCVAFGGRFVLSIDKNQATVIDMGDRSLPIYPDNPAETQCLLLQSGMRIEETFETEFAHIFSCVRT